jgi:hypothetical protein
METTASPTNPGGTQASATTTPKAGSGTGGAQGWNNGVAAMFSLITFIVSGLCLL